MVGGDDTEVTYDHYDYNDTKVTYDDDNYSDTEEGWTEERWDIYDDLVILLEKLTSFLIWNPKMFIENSSNYLLQQL